MIRRFFPDTVGGQLLVLLLAALVATQALSVVLLTHERNRAVRAAAGAEAAGRAANLALQLDAVPSGLRSAILDAASSPLVRFRLGAEAETDHSSEDTGDLVSQIRSILGDQERAVLADLHPLETMPPMPLADVPVAMRRMHAAMLAQGTDPVELTLSIGLADGNWLNGRTMFHRPGLQWSRGDLLPLGLMALAIGLVVWVTARRIVAPMQALARGADQLGRGLGAAPLLARGPRELRAATEAFNLMQDRLTRFVADRTRMLAALSHDLRSPLTAMRLRLEMLEENEDTARLAALVDEMQVLTEATLDFARGEAGGEATLEVDLAALLRELTRDAAFGDARAVLEPADPVLAEVRPTALKRALRNLIDNAMRYGKGAQVRLATEPGVAVITVTDKGPGIPENLIAKVFEPFARLDPSRSRDTGGVGLGLAIARTVVQAHGGTISLENRPEGGLLATIRLPLRCV